MKRERLDTGLVHVYTGNGKGKTTAAVGLAVRAVGHGLRVGLVQFMKGDPEYGELLAFKRLPGVVWRQCGLAGFVTRGKPSEEDLRLAREGMEEARRLLRSGGIDLLILDEVVVAIDYGLVSLDEVLHLVRSRPPRVEIVLTGRHAPPELLEIADLVTEMREVKHPFRIGVPARRGIEF